MEKVDPSIFVEDNTTYSNWVLRFLRTLEVWEVAKIMKGEWLQKSAFASAIHSDFSRNWKKAKTRTLKEYYLVKRIK